MAPFRAVKVNSATALVADDQPIARQGIVSLLNEQELTVQAEVCTMEALWREMKLHTPDILVADLNLSEEWIISEIPRLIERFPESRILVLTAQQDPAIAEKVMQAGARGYVCKHAPIRELSIAVSTVLVGGFYLDSKIGLGLLAGNTRQDAVASLGPRCKTVLALIGAGLTNVQIAKRLHLSLRTVESRRAEIKNKTGLSHRSELSALARDLNLLHLTDALSG